MYQNNFRRNLRTNLAQMFFTNYLKLQFIENSKKNFAEMQKNIDSETQRFSDLVQSYTMFINEAVMALTIILFFIFIQFSNYFNNLGNLIYNINYIVFGFKK